MPEGMALQFAMYYLVHGQLCRKPTCYLNLAERKQSGTNLARPIWHNLDFGPIWHWPWIIFQSGCVQSGLLDVTSWSPTSILSAGNGMPDWHKLLQGKGI